MTTPQRVLFVCLGNICRSPLVEAVARKHLIEAGLDVEVASCGTGGWHAGEGADSRMCAVAATASYDLDHHRARPLRSDDFQRYDLILAMDRDNLRNIRHVDGSSGNASTALFLEWAGVSAPQEFPDPYYGKHHDFEQAVVLAERGVRGLIERLRKG